MHSTYPPGTSPTLPSKYADEGGWLRTPDTVDGAFAEIDAGHGWRA